MKIWVDDVRPAPEGYEHRHSVSSVMETILECEENNVKIEVIDFDHDAGQFAKWGGDYIKVLYWLEETGRSYPIHIHSMNPVGVQNMRAIIEYNGWEEV